MSISRICILPLIAALTACGGGGSSPTDNAPPSTAPTVPGTGSFTDTTPANAAAVPGSYANPVRAAAFDRVNLLRQAAGLGAVRQAAQLDQAAQAHADYMSINQVFSHSETPGANGYTGANQTQRAQAAGYAAWSTVAEVQVGSTLPVSDGAGMVDALFAAPYHRLGLVYYRVDEAGVGHGATGVPYSIVIDLGRNPGQGAPATTAVIWPRDGDVGVWTQGAPEMPDPIPENNGSPYGYPISVSVHENKTLTVSSFTLEGPGGATVSTKLLDHATDTNLQSVGGRHFAALLPRAPLASNTTYTVRFTGAIDGVAYTKTWTFTTQ